MYWTMFLFTLSGPNKMSWNLNLYFANMVLLYSFKLFILQYNGKMDFIEVQEKPPKDF